MRPRAPHSAAALLLGAALLTACASGTGGPSAPAPPPEVTDAARLTYPLDGYKPTDEESRGIEKAQALLTADCMRRFGLAYRPPEQPRPARSGTASRYGLTDAATASRYGYAPRGGAVPPGKAPEDDLGPTGELVLGGPPLKGPIPMSLAESERTDSGRRVNGRKVPVGGCGREGFLRMYAPREGAVDALFVFQLETEAFSRARQDPDVVRAVGQWSRCMAEKGYRSDDPVSPQQDLGLSADTLGGPKAIAAAEQDVACKKRSNLVGIWYAAEVGHQERAVDRHAEALTRAKSELDARIRLAAARNG
ncbi:hypothetical protein ACFVZH_11760 [Streptomyces sp. NPDC059534]|uniref:hypothetical protein n=1 Tax=Streptomyces sp. NPDC059534 TaxID=3346859 RepID=UPI00369A5E4B